MVISIFQNVENISGEKRGGGGNLVTSIFFFSYKILKSQ